MSVMPDWAKTGGLKPGQAVAGLAFAEQRAILTRDYLADDRFDHTQEIDAFIKAGRHPGGHRHAAVGRRRPDRDDLGGLAQSRAPMTVRTSRS